MRTLTQRQPSQSNPTPGAPARTVAASRAPGGDLGNTPLSTPEYPGWGHYFGGIRVHAAAPKAVQAKLNINQPGDEYEREATRVADQLMGAGPATARWHGGRRSRRGIVDKSAGQGVGVQAKTPRQAMRGPEVDPHLEERLNQSGRGGNPLPDEVRGFFEPRMGFDFGQVRIHKDNEAARINQQLGARAFTYGRDIYFGAGEYNPRLGEGKRLIAHELTHVVQQGGRQRSSNSQPPGGGLVQRVPVAAAAPALGAAEWIALGTAGFEITQNAVNQTAGDLTYTFDEMEGVLLPGGSTNVEDYRKQHPDTDIRSHTHTVSVWHGSSGSRKAGVKFGIDFNYDGYALGNISMRILDTYDWPMWSGSVNVNLTALSLAKGGAAAVRITINFNADVTLRGGQVSSLILELDGRGLLRDATGPYNQPFFKFGE